MRGKLPQHFAGRISGGQVHKVPELCFGTPDEQRRPEMLGISLALFHTVFTIAPCIQEEKKFWKVRQFPQALRVEVKSSVTPRTFTITNTYFVFSCWWLFVFLFSLLLCYFTNNKCFWFFFSHLFVIFNHSLRLGFYFCFVLKWLC